MEEKVVKIEDVEALKNHIDSIIENSITIPQVKHSPVRREEIVMDEKVTTVFDFITNNQGVTKQNVVDVFSEKPGYSRKPIFGILRKLENYEWIKVKLDGINNHKHHLYLNNKSEIGSLAENISSFAGDYSRLLIGIEEKEFNDPERMLGLDAIVMPLKFFLRLFSYSIQSNMQHPDNEILQKKITIFSNYMEAIYIELYNTLLSKLWIQSSEEITSELIYDDSNIFHPEKIINLLRTFEKYGLRGGAEMVLDRLWDMGHNAMRFIYPYYSSRNPDITMDWRKLVTEYERFPIPTRRPYHRITRPS
jgi:hypothetical protein